VEQGDIQLKHEFPSKYLPSMHSVQFVAVPEQEIHGEVQVRHWLSLD